jgi:hypothetical protein
VLELAREARPAGTLSIPVRSIALLGVAPPSETEVRSSGDYVTHFSELHDVKGSRRRACAKDELLKHSVDVHEAQRLTTTDATAIQGISRNCAARLPRRVSQRNAQKGY